jgi:hypothetical protein
LGLQANFMNKIFEYFLIAYAISVAIFGVYYNWEFAKDNGFIMWLLFGQIVPTFKAMIWPIIELTR